MRHMDAAFDLAFWFAAFRERVQAESMSPQRSRQGVDYNLIVWTKGGVTHWAMSDGAADELKRLPKPK